MSGPSRIIPNLEVLEPRRLYDASAAFTAVSISSTPIGVQAVYVDGTHWTRAFRDELAEDEIGDANGYRILPGTPGEDELPWTNINRIAFKFSGSGVPIVVDEADLTWVSAAGIRYGVSAFTYDPDARVATWTFDKSFANYPALRRTGDRIAFNLDGDPPDGVNIWGGDHRFVLHVVPGDANHNGNISPTDYGTVRSGVGCNTADEGTSPNHYTVFKDVNTNGNVSPTDIGVVRGNTGANILTFPAPAALLQTPSIADEWFRTDRIL